MLQHAGNFAKKATSLLYVQPMETSIMLVKEHLSRSGQKTLTKFQSHKTGQISILKFETTFEYLHVFINTLILITLN